MSGEGRKGPSVAFPWPMAATAAQAAVQFEEAAQRLALVASMSTEEAAAIIARYMELSDTKSTTRAIEEAVRATIREHMPSEYLTPRQPLCFNGGMATQIRPELTLDQQHSILRDWEIVDDLTGWTMGTPAVPQIVFRDPETGGTHVFRGSTIEPGWWGYLTEYTVNDDGTPGTSIRSQLMIESDVLSTLEDIHETAIEMKRGGGR